MQYQIIYWDPIMKRWSVPKSTSYCLFADINGAHDRMDLEYRNFPRMPDRASITYRVIETDRLLDNPDVRQLAL